MRISSQEELDILREGGKRLRAIIETVGKAAQPGVAVKTLDTLAWQFIRAAGDTPAFL